jgi:hypothetical protein
VVVGVGQSLWWLVWAFSKGHAGRWGLLRMVALTYGMMLLEAGPRATRAPSA